MVEWKYEVEGTLVLWSEDAIETVYSIVEGLVLIIVMADPFDDSDVFVYTGGRVPQHLRRTITRARIDTSIEEIHAGAFMNCYKLRNIEMHRGIRNIGKRAFMRCNSLMEIQLQGVRIIDMEAFKLCDDLMDIKFGDELETIGKLAFHMCGSLRRVTLHAVSTIELCAFTNCDQLRSVMLPVEGLVTIQGRAFAECPSLRRIAIPLNENMLAGTVFDDCDGLAKVAPVGGIDKTISSLHLKSWKKEMKREIKRINRALPTLNSEGIQTDGIQQWIESVRRRIEHYKAEHYMLVREAMTLLELALWKAELEANEGEDSQRGKAKKVKMDMEAVRRELRVTSRADIVVKNVLPFLKLE
eukprot:scaffold10072_cov112-Skeletonema_marinoi.AAC.6